MTAAAIAPHGQSLTERFAWAFELVLRGFSLSLSKSRDVAPLAHGTWNRLKRLVASPTSETRAELPAPSAKAKLPQEYGWLLALAPELNTRIGRAQIETLLGDPAMLALLAEAPQAGRILRPLCHMLRIALPPALRLPPRPRRPMAATEPKPAPVARPPRPPKPRWLRWPKSPPLPGMERMFGARPRRRSGTGPPEA